MPCAYLHANISVVHVHPSTEIFVRSLAQKVLDKFVAVLEVVSAAAPLPGLAVLQVWGFVTGTALHAARTAGLGHGMGQASRGDGKQKGCLLEPWGRG